MSIDARILSQRLELQAFIEEVERQRSELHDLFLEKARAECPIPLGTKVEYEPGKFGQVDRVGFFVDYWNELDPNADVHWTVTGRKINKTGAFGVKSFQPVGPATHIVNDVSFKPKDWNAVFGISDDDA